LRVSRASRDSELASWPENESAGVWRVIVQIQAKRWRKEFPQWVVRVVLKGSGRCRMKGKGQYDTLPRE
jgi:hypothetical protein